MKTSAKPLYTQGAVWMFSLEIGPQLQVYEEQHSSLVSAWVIWEFPQDTLCEQLN